MNSIVITGSTKGIGFGLAKEFLKKGHQVTINGKNEESTSNAFYNSLNSKKIFSPFLAMFHHMTLVKSCF